MRMPMTVHLPLVSIPLEGLPIAAAALDREHVIVAANQKFVRLSGHANTLSARVRLIDLVSEQDKAAVEEALGELTIFEGQIPQAHSIKVLRAAPPSLWMSLDMSRLSHGST